MLMLALRLILKHCLQFVGSKLVVEKKKKEKEGASEKDALK